MNILIGSRALNHWNPDLHIRDDTDWDIISTKPIEGAEWHDRAFLNNDSFDQYAKTDTIKFNGELVHIMNPYGLAIIKRSHLWRNLSFQKHITHYHRYMSKWKSRLYQEDLDLLNERIALTMKRYPQGHPSLKKSKDDFFDDYVDKKYDHDYLHELVAYNEKPLYTYLQRDSSSAWCEKDLWDKFNTLNKIQCVAEEAQVIAIERFLVPSDWQYSSRQAYLKALDKVCTTLCSGWFREFAIDHYPEVFDLYDISKFEKVKGILNGS